MPVFSILDWIYLKFRKWRQNIILKIPYHKKADVEELIYIPTEYYVILNLINYTERRRRERGRWEDQYNWKRRRNTTTERSKLKMPLQKSKHIIQGSMQVRRYDFLTLIFISIRFGFTFKVEKYRKYKKRVVWVSKCLENCWWPCNTNGNYLFYTLDKCICIKWIVLEMAENAQRNIALSFKM